MRPEQAAAATALRMFLLLGALAVQQEASTCTTAPAGSDPALRMRLQGHSREGESALEQVVRDVHEMWLRKRPYFLASELDWKPKYSEADVGVKTFMSDLAGVTEGGNISCQNIGVIKAMWSDFLVQEVRLSDGSIVCLGSDNSSATGMGSGMRGAGENNRYFKFVLCLLGIDTISGVQKLANYCRCPYSAFRFAGIKDKYAITTQEVTADAQRVSASVLLNATSRSSPLFSQMRITNVSWCASHLYSGELLGNRFTVCVRNVGDLNSTLSSLRSLKLHGFVNYFGMQRFGSGSVPSIAAGRSLLARNYTEFVQHLFSPTYCSLPREKCAKKAILALVSGRPTTVKTKGLIPQTMRQLPAHCTAERQYLAAIIRGRSSQQAVDAIPFNSMYEQSYTSVCKCIVGFCSL